MKRILTYLLIAVIIIGIIGVIVYFLTRNGNQPENQAGQTGSLPTTSGGAFSQNTNGSLLNGGVPNSGSSSTIIQNLAAISDEPVLDYFIDSRGNATIIEPNGIITAITGNNADILSSSAILNIISANFSYDGAKVLVNFGDRNNPQTSVFDIKTKSWTPFPAGMTSPRWSPVDYRIAYLRNNSDLTETLTTIDASKTKNNSVAVMTLHVQDVSLLWLLKNKIMFYDAPSIYSYGSAWSFDLQKKNIISLITEQRGMEATWSTPTTTTGIVFIGDVSQYGGRLELVDSSGKETEQFSFLTLPSKCLFNPSSAPKSSNATQTTTTTVANTSSTANTSYLALYCGIPRDQDALSSGRLPDNYEQMALFTSDNIYRINTSNGNIDTLLNDQSKNIDVSDLKIFGNSLFFINRYDKKLYSIGI